MTSYFFRKPIYFFNKIFSRKEKNFLKFKIVENQKLNKKNKIICIFSHYDKDAQVDDYVLFYLKSLFDYGCDIKFVTTSDIDENEQKKLLPYCEQIVIRENIGIDFGSYKCGIELIGDIDQYEKLIIANDSVYGPVLNIAELIEYGDKNNLDIWGSTDSFELDYHIQSYFIVYKKNVFTDDAFQKFWKKIFFLKVKNNVIFNYEVGGSEYFLKRGFKLGALCSYQKIKSDILARADLTQSNTYHAISKKNINLTLWVWDLLIKKYGCPFIKRELLLANPINVKIDHWKVLLLESGQYDPELIEKHLKRIKNP